MARGFFCGQNLYLHDGTHGGRHELFRRDVEVTTNDHWLYRAGDKGEQTCPQLSIRVPLNALTRAEVGHDHEDFRVSKGPLHCIPATSFNELLVRVVEMHVGRVDQQVPPMRATLEGFCWWLTEHSKASCCEPLLDLLVVLRCEVRLNHEDGGPRSGEQPLANRLPEIGDIGKRKADSIQASSFCWLFQFFNLCSTWEFTSDARWQELCRRQGPNLDYLPLNAIIDVLVH